MYNNIVFPAVMSKKNKSGEVSPLGYRHDSRSYSDYDKDIILCRLV